ncbi:MAG: S1 family peptidase [Myxococcota bacterium]
MRRHQAWATALLVTTIAATTLGCDDRSTVVEDQCQAPRIYHGVEQSPSLGLGPQQLAALVAVYPPDRETICSGVVVRPGIVLTAGHCIDPATADRLRVGYWTPERPDTGVVSAIVHPQLDVAVLSIDPDALGADLDPIPLLGDALHDGWLDTTVELAGYGSTESFEVGRLYFAVEPIVVLEPTTVVVHGRGFSGACGGDSGGPLLARDDAGRVRVVGLLDSGHASCLQDDHYTRVDVLADWWPFEWRERADQTRGCEGIDAEGVCGRGSAIRCVDGHLEVEPCAADERCGQRQGESGFTCVEAPEDLCEGAGDLAWCDGELLVRCRDGATVETDCGTCGATCADWTPAGGAACQLAPPPAP